MHNTLDGSGLGDRAGWSLTASVPRRQQLKVSNRLSAISRVQGAMKVLINAVGEEADRAIAEQSMSTARMETSRPVKSRTVHRDVGDSAIRRVVAVGGDVGRDTANPRKSSTGPITAATPARMSQNDRPKIGIDDRSAGPATSGSVVTTG